MQARDNIKTLVTIQIGLADLDRAETLAENAKRTRHRVLQEAVALGLARMEQERAQEPASASR